MLNLPLGIYQFISIFPFIPKSTPTALWLQKQKFIQKVHNKTFLVKRRYKSQYIIISFQLSCMCSNRENRPFLLFKTRFKQFGSMRVQPFRTGLWHFHASMLTKFPSSLLKSSQLSGEAPAQHTQFRSLKHIQSSQTKFFKVLEIPSSSFGRFLLDLDNFKTYFDNFLDF